MGTGFISKEQYRGLSLRIILSTMSVMAKKTPWWSWNVSPEELKDQVDNYDTLKFTKSYRGEVVVFFAIIFAMSLLASFLLPNVISTLSVLVGFAIYAVLAYFGYRGHRWALIALIAYWAVDKSLTIFTSLSVQALSSSFVAQLIFLVAGIVVTVRAYKVEVERKKTAMQ